ncbi:hypothetical protein Tco_0394732 [Tanacetum coccineum]
MRIEQYIQMIDYGLWEFIENGNTFLRTQTVDGVVTQVAITTAEDKAQRRLELKVGSTLLMGIPNEHKLKFNSIKDAKSLLLEVLDQTFDRIQKLIIQLEIHSESISQEDVNQKFLRSLSPEWNTHTIVWRNKPDIDTLSLDDLYNNLKIYEPEVADGYANNEGKEILEEHRKETFCEWAPRNQENRNRENTRRVVPVEKTTSNALVSCNGLGYDWSDQAEEGPTNYALMAYSSSSLDSEVSKYSTCSKSCLKTVELLKSQSEQLLSDLKKSKLLVLSYKLCLKQVEKRLEFFKTNESIYLEDINVLKAKLHTREIITRELKKKLEIVQKEKEGIQLNVDKIENASKSVNKIIENQRVDNCIKGLGYNAVPPPYTGNFLPPKPDLSFIGLNESVYAPIVSEPTVKKPVVKTSEAKASKEKPKVVRKNDDAPIIEE